MEANNVERRRHDDTGVRRRISLAIESPDDGYRALVWAIHALALRDYNDIKQHGCIVDIGLSKKTQVTSWISAQREYRETLKAYAGRVNPVLENMRMETFDVSVI